MKWKDAAAFVKGFLYAFIAIGMLPFQVIRSFLDL
jgi:hypothetical protein